MFFILFNHNIGDNDQTLKNTFGYEQLWIITFQGWLYLVQFTLIK